MSLVLKSTTNLIIRSLWLVDGLSLRGSHSTKIVIKIIKSVIKIRGTLIELALQYSNSFSLRILEYYAKFDTVLLLNAFRYNEKILIRHWQV